jgi:predicted porin
MADVTASGADVKIYGKFHASYDFVDNGNDAKGADDTDDNTGVFRNSRLGFKGSEDLGNGLKGIWQVETELDNGENEIQMRNTYVGLQGDSWGKVFIGKHDSPYKMATAKLDIFSDTIADYNNIIGNHMAVDTSDPADGTIDATAYNFNARVPQMMAYVTPNMSGFQAAVARQSYQSDDVNKDESEGWSVMGMYDQGPFFASLAYEKYKGGVRGSTDNDELDSWKGGVGYAFGNSKINFVYEAIESDEKKSIKSRDAFWGAFSHKFGANEVKLAYGKADDSDADNAKDGADNWSIGIDHNVSKRTKVYAIYTNMDNDEGAGYDLYSGQNKGNYDPRQGGDDISAFSLGVIHKF